MEQWLLVCLEVVIFFTLSATLLANDVLGTKPWPVRFHALVREYDGQYGLMDSWYDWEKGIDLLVIQNQLEAPHTDLESINFYYDLKAETHNVLSFEVEILHSDWLNGGNYLRVLEVDGFTFKLCKRAEYCWDVKTRLPVYYLFYSGRSVHVIEIEEGVLLKEEFWQAPAYCSIDDQATSVETSSPRPREKFRLDKEHKEWLFSGAMSA